MNAIQIPEKPITLMQAAQLFADAVNPGDQLTFRSYLNAFLYRAHRGEIQGRLPTTREPLPTDGILPSDYVEKLVFTASDIRALAKIYDLEIGLSTPPAAQAAPDTPSRAPTTQAGLEPVQSAPARGKREDALAPLFRKAQREAFNKQSSAEVFTILKTWALLETPPSPLLGLSKSGDALIWEDSNGEPKKQNLSALRGRITRQRTREHANER